MTASPQRTRSITTLQTLVERLGGSPAPQFDAFASLFSLRGLAKGACFVRAGDTPANIAVVAGGIARMYYTRSDGKEFNKGFVSAPDFMSALEALLTQTPSKLTVQAITEMELLVASYASVVEFFERDMYWQRLGRLVIEQVYVKKVRREASLLMNSAAERYEEFLAEHRALASRVPDYQIAAYLGITPQALSRLRKARSQHR